MGLIIIFILFVVMIWRTDWLRRNEKSNRKGKSMKRYGRCKW